MRGNVLPTDNTRMTGDHNRSNNTAGGNQSAAGDVTRAHVLTQSAADQPAQGLAGQAIRQWQNPVTPTNFKDFVHIQQGSP